MAREGREDEAFELLRLVQAAGEALGDRHPKSYLSPFSQPFSAHSAAQLAKDLDQPGDTLRAARRVEDPSKLDPSVRARYLLNVAWANSLTFRPQEALEALRQVEKIAPELLSHHGLARSIVETLLPLRHRTQLPGLIGLAERTRVAV
jgi:hypothetical protein